MFALVAHRIERGPAEAEKQVQFLPGAPDSLYVPVVLASVTAKKEPYYRSDSFLL